jgi:O-antigen/teichoic acid export membrane protein
MAGHTSGVFKGQLVIASFKLPLSAIIPGPLLAAGCICLRRARASASWVLTWAAAAASGLAIEALFLVRFVRMLKTPFYNRPQPSWRALDFAIAVAATGIATIGTLAGATWSVRRRNPAV